MRLLRVFATAVLAVAALSCRGEQPGEACADGATVGLTPSAMNLAPGEEAGVRARVGWIRVCEPQVLAARAWLPTEPRLAQSTVGGSGDHPLAVSWQALKPYIANVQPLTDSTAEVVAVAPGDTWVLATAVGDTAAVAGLIVTVTGN